VNAPSAYIPNYALLCSKIIIVILILTYAVWLLTYSRRLTVTWQPVPVEDNTVGLYMAAMSKWLRRSHFDIAAMTYTACSRLCLALWVSSKFAFLIFRSSLTHGHWPVCNLCICWRRILPPSRPKFFSFPQGLPNLFLA